MPVYDKVQIWQRNPDSTLEHYARKAIDGRKVVKDIDYLSSFRPKTSTLTLVLKLHGLGRAKENELLWGMICATNLTSAILGYIWTALEFEKEHPLFAHISQELEAKLARKRAREAAKAQAEAAKKKSKPTKKVKQATSKRAFSTPAPGERSSNLADTFTTYFNYVPGFTSVDYPLITNLRRGVFEHCATMLITWDQRVRQFASDARKPEPNTGEQAVGDVASASAKSDNAPARPYGVPDFTETYALWKHFHDEYEIAAEVPMPFGPLRGKTLGELRKRALRWLLQHLPSEEAIVATLGHLEVLRHPKTNPPALVKEAKQARHLWRYARRQQRRLRASPLIQYRSRSQGTLIRLGRLSRRERELLHQQLTELKDLREKFITIEQAVKSVLRGAPPRYPTVIEVPHISPKELRSGSIDNINVLRERAKKQYSTDLNWFRDFAPSGARPGTKHHYSTDELAEVEEDAKARMLASGHASEALILQPLRYLHAMKPSQGTDRSMATFALLYAKYTPTETELETKYLDLPRGQREASVREELARGEQYTYRLVLKVAGQFGPRFAETKRSHPNDRPPSDDQFLHIYTKVKRRGRLRDGANHGQMLPWEWHKRSLYCADYPETAFPTVNVHGSPAVMCSLECGWKDDQGNLLQGDRLIRQLIEAQRVAQQQAYESQDNVPIKPIEACLPSTAFSSAQIACRTNAVGKLEFFALLPVKVSVPALEAPLRSISGIHEHGNGYTRALISPDGTVVDIDDIAIPPHVWPEPDGSGYSDNYVYEVAQAIVRDASSRHAYIGIEDTRYLKSQPSLSRQANRKRFGRPSARVMDTLDRKAPLSGLVKPIRTGGVSPRKDCGFCGKLDEGVGSITMHETTKCYRCQSKHLHSVLHIPTMLSATAIAYHLPGVTDLKLDGDTLAAIFDGTITRWNDARITVHNQHASLPDLPIKVVHPTDDSSVTRALSAFLLQSISASKRRGAKSQQTAISGEIEEAQSQRRSIVALQQAEGAIGAVAWNQACDAHLAVAAIKNAAGQFVRPSQVSITVAGEQARLERPYDLRLSIVHPKDAPEAYPIAYTTWVLIAKEQKRVAQAKALTDFLYWTVAKSNNSIVQHNRVPLPKKLREAAISCLEQVMVGGKPIFEAPKINASEGDLRQHSLCEFHPRRVRGSLLSGGGSEHVDLYSTLTMEYQELVSGFSIDDRMSSMELRGGDALKQGADYVLVDIPLDDHDLAGLITDDDHVLCVDCGRSWNAKEPWFTCGRCGVRLLARDNVALAVAQHTREQLCDYADRRRAKQSNDISP